MKDYLNRLLDVEMQRFGVFTTVMIASSGGVVGLLVSKEISLGIYVLVLAGTVISTVSALLALRSYIRINKVLRVLKDA